MLSEAFPRLAVRLRSVFPDSKIEVSQERLRVMLPAFPTWEVYVIALPCHEQFQYIESNLTLTFDCLRNVSNQDLNRFIAAENLGLRGVTLTAERVRTRPGVNIRASFIGQKGRTVDEAENLAIDILSLLRFARIIEDRILRSVVGLKFNYDIYYSQFLSRTIGRHRYINYARSIFRGSPERVFGQVTKMLNEECNYEIKVTRPFNASLSHPSSPYTINLRIPDEIPMISTSCALRIANWNSEVSFDLVARLNQRVSIGHFEVNSDGTLISFVTWKHLTNDLRHYSLDHVVAGIHKADALLSKELPDRVSLTESEIKAHAATMSAYKVAA